MLQKEWIKTVVQVVLEILHRTHLRQYLLDDVLMVAEDIVQFVWLEIVTRLQIDEFSERESSQIVTLYHAVQFRVLFLQSHYAGTGENNFQFWIEVIALSEFLAPVGLFENLIYEQCSAALLHEIACKICNASTLEIEIVHVYIQALTVGRTKVLFGILEEEGRLAYASCSLYAYHAVAPVYFVHQVTTDRSIGVLNKVSMCAVE